MLNKLNTIRLRYNSGLSVRRAAENQKLARHFILHIVMIAWLACVGFVVPANAQADSKTQSNGTLSIHSVQATDPTVKERVLANILIPLTLPELETLSVRWLAIVAGKTREVADLQIDLLAREAKSSDYNKLSMLIEERANLFRKFDMVVTSLEKKGGETKLVTELRAYRDAVIAEETSLASPKALFSATVKWLQSEEGGIRLLGSGLLVIFSIGVLILIARIVRRAVQSWIGRVKRISNLLQDFLVTAVYWIVLTFGLLFVLSAIGFDITPLYALVGGASFIIAFAFQDTLSNFANGLMIMVNKPFDSGDYVDIGGVGGTVKSLSMVATTVTTPDNQVIVIPNKNVWGNTITNVTASKTRRVDLIFGISYEDEIHKALEVIRETVTSHPMVKGDPEAIIRVHELGENSINIICRPWTKTEDYWTVYWDLNQQVKEAFDLAGISIPYPQRDVHLKTSN